MGAPARPVVAFSQPIHGICMPALPWYRALLIGPYLLNVLHLPACMPIRSVETITSD